MIVLATAVAIALVLAQGLAVLGFLKFVRSFGAYTESQQHMTNALLTVHESNLMIHEANKKILDELRRLHPILKKAESA